VVRRSLSATPLDVSEIRRALVEVLTDDEILQMFRDFGLEYEDQRRRLLSTVEVEPPGAEGRRTQVFIRVESTTNLQEGGHAELA